MKPSVAGAFLASAVIAGCAVPQPAPPAPHVITAPFDAAEARALMAPGVNQIKGNGFLRQQGGGVVTCAGEPVYLVPATAYAAERMRVIYGSEAGGLGMEGRGPFPPNVQEYLDPQRDTQCDAQGWFTFDQVADGRFFVITLVRWKVGNSPQGGYLMRPVTVSGGQMKSLVVTAQ